MGSMQSVLEPCCPGIAKSFDSSADEKPKTDPPEKKDDEKLNQVLSTEPGPKKEGAEAAASSPAVAK
jgi:hypothetical protein